MIFVFRNFDIDIKEGTSGKDGSSDVDRCMSFWRSVP